MAHIMAQNVLPTECGPMLVQHPHKPRVVPPPLKIPWVLPHGLGYGYGYGPLLNPKPKPDGYGPLLNPKPKPDGYGPVLKPKPKPVLKRTPVLKTKPVLVLPPKPSKSRSAQSLKPKPSAKPSAKPSTAFWKDDSAIGNWQVANCNWQLASWWGKGIHQDRYQEGDIIETEDSHGHTQWKPKATNSWEKCGWEDEKMTWWLKDNDNDEDKYSEYEMIEVDEEEEEVEGDHANSAAVIKDTYAYDESYKVLQHHKVEEEEVEGDHANSAAVIKDTYAYAESYKVWQHHKVEEVEGDHANNAAQRSCKPHKLPNPPGPPKKTRRRGSRGKGKASAKCAKVGPRCMPFQIDVEELRYSQLGCSDIFTCGRPVLQLVQDLLDRKVRVSDPFLLLSVFETRDSKTKRCIWRCKDNRRLWALKEYAKRSGKKHLKVNVNLFDADTIHQVQRFIANSDFTDGKGVKMRRSGRRNKGKGKGKGTDHFF